MSGGWEREIGSSGGGRCFGVRRRRGEGGGLSLSLSFPFCSDQPQEPSGSRVIKIGAAGRQRWGPIAPWAAARPPDFGVGARAGGRAWPTEFEEGRSEEASTNLPPLPLSSRSRPVPSTTPPPLLALDKIGATRRAAPRIPPSRAGSPRPLPNPGAGDCVRDERGSKQKCLPARPSLRRRRTHAHAKLAASAHGGGRRDLGLHHHFDFCAGGLDRSVEKKKMGEGRGRGGASEPLSAGAPRRGRASGGALRRGGGGGAQREARLFSSRVLFSARQARENLPPSPHWGVWVGAGTVE